MHEVIHQYGRRNSKMALGVRSKSPRNNGEAAYPDTNRIEAFSDGVFAVAVTLLVFNIKLPDSAATGQLGEVLLSQWPAYAAYMVSFVTVGIFWANHHYMFHYIARSDHLLDMLNVLFLMCISSLPFSTSLVAAFIQNPIGQRTAVLVYVGTFLVSAVLFTVVWLFASRGKRLLETHLDQKFIRKTTRRYFLGVVSYLAAFTAAFWSITLSLAIVVAMALLFFLPTSHAPSPSDPKPVKEN
jgi:uncharacterized membrane protein